MSDEAETNSEIRLPDDEGAVLELAGAETDEERISRLPKPAGLVTCLASNSPVTSYSEIL